MKYVVKDIYKTKEIEERKQRIISIIIGQIKKSIKK